MKKVVIGSRSKKKLEKMLLSTYLYSILYITVLWGRPQQVTFAGGAANPRAVLVAGSMSRSRS